MSGAYSVHRVRVGAVIAVAAVAGFLVWYFAIRDTVNGETVHLRPGSGPVAASESDLSALSDELQQPVYWAGPKSGTTLELTRTQDGRIYVRYLTGNAKIGAPEPSYLTVGTYPFKGAHKALEDVATKPGAVMQKIADHGLVVTNTDAPTSVYLAYPNQDFQIEVYDPDPKRALSLVTSGAIQPVG